MCDKLGLFVYAFFLISLTFGIYIRKKNPVILALTFLLITFFASLRGGSGVDTALYIQRFQNITFDKISIVEPILPTMMFLSKNIMNSFTLFSIFYGLLLSSLYYILFKNNKNSIYFGLSIFPLIYIDSLYNGLRIGLAYPILFLAIVNSSKSYLLFSVTAHISSLLITPLIIIKKKYIFLGILTAAVYIYIIGFPVEFISERYISKYYKYQELVSRSSFAGIADTVGLFISLIIYYITVLNYKEKKLFYAITLTFFVLFILYFILINKFMFMLRIVRLSMIAVFALIATNQNKINKLALYISLAFGILYSLNYLRQISATCVYPNGGFLPMQLIFT